MLPGNSNHFKHSLVVPRVKINHKPTTSDRHWYSLLKVYTGYLASQLQASKQYGTNSEISTYASSAGLSFVMTVIQKNLENRAQSVRTYLSWRSLH